MDDGRVVEEEDRGKGEGSGWEGYGGGEGKWEKDGILEDVIVRSRTDLAHQQDVSFEKKAVRG